MSILIDRLNLKTIHLLNTLPNMKWIVFRDQIYFHAEKTILNITYMKTRKSQDLQTSIQYIVVKVSFSISYFRLYTLKMKILYCHLIINNKAMFMNVTIEKLYLTWIVYRHICFNTHIKI